MKRTTTIYLIALSLLCFSAMSLFSQKAIEKDSLSTYTFDELSDKFYAAKPDSLKAVLYAKYYIEKAKKEKDTLQAADGNYYLSDITKDSIYFVKYWNDIIEKTSRLNNKLYPVVSDIQIGEYYRINGMQKRALNHFLKAQLFLKLNNNDSLEIINTHKLAHIKAENKQIQDALILYKKVYNYYKKQKKNHNSNNFHSVLVNLSNNFSKMKLYDSAIYYNKVLINIGQLKNSKIILGYAINNEGKIEFRKSKYETAINKLKKSLPYILDDENFDSLSYTYFLIAKSYEKIKQTEKSIEYYLLIDSLFLKTENFYKSQRPAYKFLANYYKEKKNYKKQLEHINKYIRVDSVLNSRAKRINKTLTENYDIPNLLAQKKLIENRLKGDLSTTKKWVFGISTLAFLLSFFLVHQSRKRKSYKKRFHELMKPVVEKVSTKEQMIAKKENTIPKKTIESILHLLEQFENNQTYISSEITLSSLAKTFETNSKYLSQLINQYKGKSFNNYINELRIKYTVEKLKADSTFRKYSIKAIANEVGFNTTESFSKAFFKNTGIRPSFFIKELERK